MLVHEAVKGLNRQLLACDTYQGPESGLQSQLKAKLEFYGEARARPHYEKGEECSGLHHEGTGIRNKENNKEKSGVLCDSHKCDGMGTEYQPKCTFHLF